jgi:hypothetical protein
MPTALERKQAALLKEEKNVDNRRLKRIHGWLEKARLELISKKFLYADGTEISEALAETMGYVTGEMKALFPETVPSPVETETATTKF